jgi:DcuC family C4-dicarboxylate transporter
VGLAVLPVLLLIALAVYAVIRGADVRLALLSAALAIAALSGDVTPVVREFLGTFSNEKFVVPICSAMGFAYVLKHTGCERHLVRLLVRPLAHARGLLVPGVVVVGFLVNVPVISQTSTAVCIGPVVIPLMRAAGYSMATIGACLLLGVSVGGELLNPGAPELLTVFDRTKVSSTEQAQRYLPALVFTQLAVSGAVFWLLSLWWERGKRPDPSSASDAAQVECQLEHINLLKALVPLVPLGLLFASGFPPPPDNWVNVPDAWVVLPKAGQRDQLYGSRLVGLAMLVGVGTAMVAAPGRARDCVKHFFDGAGYGFANIISLIVAASCFGAAIRESGLATELGRLIESNPRLMDPLAVFVPLAFAALGGSGMASTQSLYGFFYDPAVALGLDPTAVGALVSVGSAAGRTMSPVAAVVLMCASLTGTRPIELVKRVAAPLLIGVVVVLVLRGAGVL